MTRRRWIALAAALLAVLAFGLWKGGVIGSSESTSGAGSAGTNVRGVDPAFADAMARAGRSGKLTGAGVNDRDDADVTISGQVIDVKSGDPVGDVEVVFRDETGEQTTQAGASGKYSITVPRGHYRAFVRDDSVLSIGRSDTSRLPSLPSAEVAGVPDEALMPVVAALHDADSVDLSVVRGGTIVGQVIDMRGKPVAGAVVRARGNPLRPALGTDVAESDAAGNFELHVAAGGYILDATHDRYAGISGTQERIAVAAGSKQTSTLTLTAGCVIAGKVVDARGNPAGDGAIEKRWGQTELEFGPTGRVEPDGKFRWVTTDEVDVTLRAWPWKSPPSPAATFTCKDGARFTNVVFTIPDRAPDIEGTLADEHGTPVAFAFIDLAPRDPGGISQQERTDANGHWQVFNMPAGRYRVMATAPGHGVVADEITAPATKVALTLGGTGRIEGTTTLLANGTIELAAAGCVDSTRRGGIPMADSHRLIQVSGGHFTIDDMPACSLIGAVTWRNQRAMLDVEVPAGGVATVELDLGPPRAKAIHGIVKDADGRVVADALVTAAYKSAANTMVRTDAAGRYTLQTFSGATVTADGKGASGRSEVGMANIEDEEVDITLAPGDPDRDRGWDD